MKQENLWDLDSLIRKNDFEKEYKRTCSRIEAFKSTLMSLKPSIREKEFKEFVRKYLELEHQVSRVIGFASLFQAVNVSASESAYYASRSSDIAKQYADIELTIKLWIEGKAVKGLKHLDGKNAKRLFAYIPELHFYFEHIRESSKHGLSMEEEKIWTVKDINLKGPVLKLYGMIFDGLTFEMRIKGKPVKTVKTLGELSSYFRSSKTEERKAAYTALLTQCEKNVEKIFTIYRAVVMDWHSKCEFRHFDSPISIRNFSNDVDDGTIETLLDVCDKNKDIFREYFGVKARLLGLPKLSRTDINAPAGQSGEKWDFTDAKAYVLSIFKSFNEKFYVFAKKIFEEDHVDSHPRVGKRSGAFCSTLSPKITPYVLLNFTGDMDSVFTMAHELGHGVHSLYSSRLPSVVSHSSLTLAETASTFAEMLMFDEILKVSKSNKQKIALLSNSLNDTYATIMRQAFFVKFEKEAFCHVKNGATSKELNEVYMKNLRSQFGDSILLDEMFKYEWAYISHIFSTPFYCYAYSFGQLLSMSLYGMYKEQGKSFIPVLEKILSMGSVKKPREILKSCGIDIGHTAFWQKSFEMIKDNLEQLKELSGYDRK